MYVKHISKNKFLRDSHQESNRVRKLLVNENNDMFAQAGLIVNSKVQKYLYEDDQSGKVSKIFKNLLLDACIRSEAISGGSGDLCFCFAIELHRRLRQSSHFKTFQELHQFLMKKEEFWIKNILDNRILFDSSVFNKIINKNFENESSRELVREIIKVSGIDSVIVTEKVNNVKSKIKRNNGFTFDISVDPNVRKILGSWERKDVNVIVIDGIIESVSEVHHILETAAESREPYIIFCRSMSEEVRHTILHNNARKTLDVMPIEVGLDENTLNILNDIAICSGSDLVSSLTGDLISHALKKSAIVSRVEVFEKAIVIHSQGTSIKVKNQIEYLQAKKQNLIRKNLPFHENVNELEHLLDKRIKSLTSFKTTVSVGTSARKQDPLLVEKLDKFFRIISSTSHHGAVQTNIKINEPDQLDKIFMEIFHKEGVVATLGAIYVIKNTISFLNNVYSVGGCLLNEI